MSAGFSAGHSSQTGDAELRRRPFRYADLVLVQGFSCGNEPWETHIERYLKSVEPDGALAQAAFYNNHAWLYFLGDNFVGYGVLGLTRWKWPDPSRRVQYPHLVALGVDRRFWGQPPGPRERRYAGQILLDIMFETQQLRGVPKLLTLFVHERNARAIKFYTDFGFEIIPGLTTDDPHTGIHIGMAVRLPEQRG